MLARSLWRKGLVTCVAVGGFVWLYEATVLDSRYVSRLRGITEAEPGSYRGTHLVVTDIEAARAELVGRGVEVSDIRHLSAEGWKPGADPAHTDYNSFADLADPDGNTWVLQEVPEAAS